MYQTYNNNNNNTDYYYNKSFQGKFQTILHKVYLIQCSVSVWQSLTAIIFVLQFKRHLTIFKVKRFKSLFENLNNFNFELSRTYISNIK